MPWPAKQRAAIAADMRRKGKTPGQVSQFFRAHGHGGGDRVNQALRGRKKR